MLTARGLDYLRPTAAERDETNRIIMEELVYDKFQPDSVAYFQRVIARMKDDGCDAVILGCTEIPLIISDANSPLPTLDSTRLLARAALRRAVQGSVRCGPASLLSFVMVVLGTTIHEFLATARLAHRNSWMVGPSPTMTE